MGVKFILFEYAPTIFYPDVKLQLMAFISSCSKLMSVQYSAKEHKLNKNNGEILKLHAGGLIQKWGLNW